ncbi:DUF1173 domain-containing protein [Nocardia farcinica]|uniref:DUF1173 family protein n=1 Tax=Nocardia farcinica TaxID=37329 RepID=UPI00189398E3|nr:DUF1173 family protein [Nocardia farcinica]MBF6388146.1 DUF1173 domain-containing protein [Nocardia farcinica]UEX26356.1 DUF1173 domain-containing protein [Nocardia farcinica]
MTTSTFTVLGDPVTPTDPDWQARLAEARRAGVRPRCMCTPAGAEMYVASVGDHLIVKRMPNSGATHAPACDSFEPPAELTGLGQVLGAAIEDDGEETKLKLAFALSMNGSARIPAASAEPSDSVTADPAKLSLRGTLHYLWEQAEFNRWVPRMVGKRNWRVVRGHLLGAARNKTTKGQRFIESLYLPDPYHPDRKTELAARRARILGSIADSGAKRRRLLLVVAEVASIAEGRLGHKMLLVEAPDCHFLLPDDLHGRMVKRFATELELWAADEETRLIVAGTIHVNRSGVPTFQELTLMPVTKNWIPYESVTEHVLLDHLTEHQRSFVKGLRYNLADSKALAAAVLTDTEVATALYLADSDATRQAVDELCTESDLPSWIWDTRSELPELPPRR